MARLVYAGSIGLQFTSCFLFSACRLEIEVLWLAGPIWPTKNDFQNTGACIVLLQVFVAATLAEIHMH
jgi:hypothetical protein